MDTETAERIRLRTEYADYLARLLEYPIHQVMRSFNGPIHIALTGGRALNFFLTPEYELPSYDWDLHVWNENDPEDESVMQTVVQRLIPSIEEYLPMIEPYIKTLDKLYDTHITDISYLTHTTFNFETIPVEVGQIFITLAGLGKVPIVDVIHQYHTPNEFVEADGIKFLSLSYTIPNLKQLYDLPDYYKRDRVYQKLKGFIRAVQRGGLSCNFYRSELVLNPKDVTLQEKMQRCIDSTIMGVPDMILGPISRRRYHTSKRDIDSQQKYYDSLSPQEKRILSEYTTKDGQKINFSIFNTFEVDPTLPLDPRVAIIQTIISNAPPLTQRAQIYKVARFGIDKNGKTNGDLEKGDVEIQHWFTSANADNWFDPGPFLDEFAPCCAYVIDIPVGAQILILPFGGEETILPYGCAFSIKNWQYDNVTFWGSEKVIYYNNMKTYRVDYQSPFH